MHFHTRHHQHQHIQHASSAQNTKAKGSSTTTTTETKVCNGRGKSYCLVHRRYFETSWCPDCSSTPFNH